MLSVSVKLTWLVLVFPILWISLHFIVGFYFYRMNLDASAFFTAISSLLSAVLGYTVGLGKIKGFLSKETCMDA